MNYQVIYNTLINKRKIHFFDGYGEIHHIIPVCVGGTDDTENLVKLTAKEHFVAHQKDVNLKFDWNNLLVSDSVKTPQFHCGIFRKM